ncbi:hypothetical protein K488DRAFT_67342, partial [Vararia minispora EC-137]
DFFGMRLVVRHRVDACLPGLTAGLTGRTPYEVGSTPFTPESMARYWGFEEESGLVVTERAPTVACAGRLISQSVLVQTVVHARPYVTPDDHVAAYLAGIPYIHVGVVRDGEVQKVHMVRASAKVAREKHEAALEVLGQTLERVHDIVLGRRGQLSVVCTNGVLKVFEKAGGACFLPDEPKGQSSISWSLSTCHEPKEIGIGSNFSRCNCGAECTSMAGADGASGTTTAERDARVVSSRKDIKAGAVRRAVYENGTRAFFDRGLR